MDGQYIVPVIGQTYLNRNGGEYRCTGNMCYESDEQMRRALSLGEHRASLVRIKDGWSLIAHGMIPPGALSILIRLLPAVRPLCRQFEQMPGGYACFAWAFSPGHFEEVSTWTYCRNFRRWRFKRRAV